MMAARMRANGKTLPPVKERPPKPSWEVEKRKKQAALRNQKGLELKAKMQSEEAKDERYSSRQSQGDLRHSHHHHHHHHKDRRSSSRNSPDVESSATAVNSPPSSPPPLNHPSHSRWAAAAKAQSAANQFAHAGAKPSAPPMPPASTRASGDSTTAAGATGAGAGAAAPHAHVSNSTQGWLYKAPKRTKPPAPEVPHEPSAYDDPNFVPTPVADVTYRTVQERIEKCGPRERAKLMKASRKIQRWYHRKSHRMRARRIILNGKTFKSSTGIRPALVAGWLRKTNVFGFTDWRYCYIDPHHHELVYLPRDPHNFGHPLDDVKTRAKAKRQVEKDDWGNPKGFQPGFFTKMRRRVTGHAGAGSIDMNLALVERRGKIISLRTSKLYTFVAPNKERAKEWEHRLGDWQELFLHKVESADSRANARKRTMGAKQVAAGAFFQ